jgi:hypothetical protein
VLIAVTNISVGSIRLYKNDRGLVLVGANTGRLNGPERCSTQSAFGATSGRRSARGTGTLAVPVDAPL